MTQYVLLLPGDEKAWEQATPEERSAEYARHEKFAAMLAERGHRVTGGAELAPSRTARLVRGGGQVTVTEGPYAESVEQLTGFYLVDSDDLDDLLEVAGYLAGPDGVIEVRATVGGTEP